ncbi:LemA family protein [Candidatus Parcubacteria bacterium]|nr:MAG: LemA family protein [Candidatus Parcubacteria bacterium]
MFLTTPIGILIIVIAVILIWFIGTYNSLIRRRNRVEESWSDIEVQLKRRYDLIPNLLETVKGYAKHEKQVFENVTSARAAAMGAKTIGEHSKTENMLSSALKTLFAVSENYPQLRASENFKSLQDELTDTENKIQAARRFFNSTVLSLNTSIQTFPTNIIAGMFGFKTEEFFDIDEKGPEGQPVNVKF